MRDFWKPMPVSGKLIRELLLLFLLFGVQQSYAQRITRQYNNVSFSAALKDLNARQHGKITGPKGNRYIPQDRLILFRVCEGQILDRSKFHLRASVKSMVRGIRQMPVKEIRESMGPKPISSPVMAG